ncbi:FAD-dependent monooxygenase [Rhodanobacter sp. L36]|uniref:FAD-dependent monooxygenase n=1 Tax=Rhodanobacter sp. L36 TaxID=1747221 RepID=UPI00131C7A33|nr:FAD-dependent monooxygenase [Rhodanobacter sp. L36]
MNAQVLIVGAGPVGLTMAAELARYGVPVRIIDKAAERTDKSKALVLWSRTLELLDRASGSGPFIDAGRKVHAVNLIAGNQLIGRVELGAIESPYPWALMIPQSDTERLLESHLNDLGVRVERQTELMNFDDVGGSVTSLLQHGDGTQEHIETRWMIGCDGAHSTVRHGLGLPFAGDTLKSDWILADLHIAGMPLPDSELGMYFHPEGVLATFPIGPGRYRVIADLGPAQGEHPAEPTLAEVQAVIDRRGPPGLTVSDPIWLAAFRINERKVADYRSGNIFVAGDAAHVHSPAGGQGMNTGMQDAFNLAWKIAMTAQRRCTAAVLLESYSVERSAVGEQVLSNAGRLTALAVTKSHVLQAIRDRVVPFLLGFAPVRHAMIDTMSELAIHYANSPLNGNVAHRVKGPGVGERAPPIAGQTPFGAGGIPRFALCAEQSVAAAALLARYPALLDETLRAAYGVGGLWLVRPDGYVAAVATVDDIKSLVDHLDTLAYH